MSEEKKSIFTALSDKYGGQVWFRALVQAIPYVGGSLDTLVSNQGQKWREERLQSYVDVVASKIVGLEQKFERMLTTSSEESYDLFRSHIENVDRCRSATKRKHFANILLNQVDYSKNWNEPETATRLLSTLTDNHILVLKSMCSAPVCPSPFEGLRVSVIEALTKDQNNNIPLHILVQAFPQIPAEQLRLLVVELLSSGLVKDEGVGRYGATAMEKFSPLPTGDWFLTWIERI